LKGSREKWVKKFSSIHYLDVENEALAAKFYFQVLTSQKHRIVVCFCFSVGRWMLADVKKGKFVELYLISGDVFSM
jgi:hypothetical protein